MARALHPSSAAHLAVLHGAREAQALKDYLGGVARVVRVGGFPLRKVPTQITQSWYSLQSVSPYGP